MVLATAACAIGMPFAVTGIIGAAAGMVSAETTVGGGGVAAWATVATLQLVGIAGLGSAGTCAVAAAVTMAGGVSSFGVYVTNTGFKSNQENIKLEEPARHLSLCAWRMSTFILAGKCVLEKL